MHNNTTSRATSWNVTTTTTTERERERSRFPTQPYTKCSPKSSSSQPSLAASTKGLWKVIYQAGFVDGHQSQLTTDQIKSQTLRQILLQVSRIPTTYYDTTIDRVEKELWRKLMDLPAKLTRLIRRIYSSAVRRYHRTRYQARLKHARGRRQGLLFLCVFLPLDVRVRPLTCGAQ